MSNTKKDRPVRQSQVSQSTPVTSKSISSGTSGGTNDKLLSYATFYHNQANIDGLKRCVLPSGITEAKKVVVGELKDVVGYSC